LYPGSQRGALFTRRPVLCRTCLHYRGEARLQRAALLIDGLPLGDSVAEFHAHRCGFFLRDQAGRPQLLDLFHRFSGSTGR